MERPAVRGHSHLSNGQSAERRYNSLERYLQSPSQGSVTRIKQGKGDYEKIKRATQQSRYHQATTQATNINVIDYGGQTLETSNKVAANATKIS